MPPTPAQPTDKASSRRLNTVNLDPRQLAELLNAMDAEKGSKANHANRGFVRWPYPHPSIPLRIFQSGASSPTELRLAGRNLSNGGISLLHSSFMHTGAKVEVLLTRPGGKPQPFPGTVTRCTHVKGVIHQLGIKFDKPITAKDFVKTDAFSECFSLENVTAEQLKGLVVYAAESPMDQKIVQHYLRETQIRLRTTSSAKEAMTLAEDSCDLVLCDFDLPDMNGVEFVMALRASGINAPVIMTTSDTSLGSKARSADTQVSAFLTKPIAQQTLFRALAEFMGTSQSITSSCSTLPPDDPNRALIPGFLEQLKAYLSRLNNSVKRGDADAVRTICLQLMGVAPTVGYAGIAAAARDCQEALDKTPCVAECARQIKMLTGACERAKA